MFNNLEDKYLQKMLYFDAGRNLYSYTADCYKNLLYLNDIESLSHKIICSENHRFINVSDINCVCTAQLVVMLANVCRNTEDVFIFCDDFFSFNIYNGVYIPCCDVFLFRGEITANGDSIDLSRFYYLTDRRNETDIYYKESANYFFRKRYELT